jgi:hypothetical protein
MIRSAAIARSSEICCCLHGLQNAECTLSKTKVGMCDNVFFFFFFAEMLEVMSSRKSILYCMLSVCVFFSTSRF